METLKCAIPGSGTCTVQTRDLCQPLDGNKTQSPFSPRVAQPGVENNPHLSKFPCSAERSCMLNRPMKLSRSGISCPGKTETAAYVSAAAK